MITKSFHTTACRTVSVIVGLWNAVATSRSKGDETIAAGGVVKWSASARA